MQIFTVDSRDTLGDTGTCDTCCCDPARSRPGDTNQWTINYSPWSAMIAGHGLCANPRIEVAALKVATSTIANTHYATAIANGGTAVIDLAANATLPATVTATYEFTTLGGPLNGAATISAAGVLTYTANPGWSGNDVMYAKMTASNGQEIIRQVTVHTRVQGNTTSVAPALPTTPVVIGPIAVHGKTHLINFPVTVLDYANPGDVYRVTVKQDTMDCDGNTYSHVSCYDLAIGKCN